jgi:hypothetical protein
VLLVSSWFVWSWFVRFCVGFSFRAGCIFRVFLFQGLEKSLRLSGTLVVRMLWPPALPALPTGLTGVTGLTGAGHRSDRCSTGSKPCKFPLCVLVCFGSGGCLLVPRSSSTSVAAWTWPTWVVSRRRVFRSLCSSCWRLYLLREEFLSALIRSPPLSGLPSRSFKGVVVGHPSDGENLKTSKIAL